MAAGQNFLATLGLVTSSLIAVVANSLLLLVFFRRRGLRNVSNRFVINLLVTNLLSSLFLAPLLIVNQEIADDVSEFTFGNATASASAGNRTGLVFNEEIEEIVEGLEVRMRNFNVIVNSGAEYSEVVSGGVGGGGIASVCHAARGFTNLICTASILSILLIGIDQYFAVVHPLRYHSYMDKCKSSALIVCCWALSAVAATSDVLVGSSDASFWKFCEVDVDADAERDVQVSALRVVYSLAYFTVVILVPFVGICAIYVCIYTAAHKNSARMRKSVSANSTVNLNQYSHLTTTRFSDGVKPLPKVRSAPDIVGAVGTVDVVRDSVVQIEETPPSPKSPRVSRSSSDRTSKSIIVSLKWRISNASVFRYREETRAAKISVLVIFMALVCYTPYGFAVLLNATPSSPQAQRLVGCASLLLLALSNIASPFLFAYRNKRIQREVFKFLRLLPSKASEGSATRVVASAAAPRRSSLASRLSRRGSAVDADRPEAGAGARPPDARQPFIDLAVPEVVEVATCKPDSEKKSILKRVCSKNWSTYKKCNFITVPDSCLDARGSFSSASTQISTEE